MKILTSIALLLGFYLIIARFMPGLTMERSTKVKETGNVTEITEDSFEEFAKLNGELLVIKCWAPSCLPSYVDKLQFGNLAIELEGAAQLGLVNVDEFEKFGRVFRVERIPTFLFIRDRKVEQRVVGMQSLKDLRTLIEYRNAQYQME